MPKTTDRVALDDWYAVESAPDLGATPIRRRLLGADLLLRRDAAAAPEIREVRSDGTTGPRLPAIERYGLVFTTLGTPARGVVDIPEAAEPGRRFVPCGWFTIRASGLRMVENFLDMAHFPYVHAGILGSEPHTEVVHYASRIDREADEVWAEGCRFFQPRAAASDTEGLLNAIDYRVPSPFVVMLYKVSPSQPARRDVIAMFVQPMEEDHCRAVAVMWMADDISTHTELLHFEQVIFLQDRLILENQRPRTLPLDPRAEIPTRADGSSVAYRRWLKERGLRFGTAEGAAP